MQWPLTDPDTLFEERLHALPSETVQMARTCKALVRAKKVKTPAQLLRVVFFYCGLDKPWREVAGTFTALYESMTDQAIAERLRACGPWGQALLRQMFPMAALERLPSGRRFVVIDASSMQAPGATGTDHRLHIAMDLGVLAVSRGLGQQCPYRRNAQALHLHSGRYRRGRPRLCAVPRQACGAPAGRRAHRSSQSLQGGPGGRDGSAVGAERRLATPGNGNAAHAGGDTPRSERPG